MCLLKLKLYCICNALCTVVCILVTIANLSVHHVRFVKATNDICLDGNPDKHYITLFMQAEVSEDSPPLENMEPHKCEGWRWMELQELAALAASEVKQQREKQEGEGVSEGVRVWKRSMFEPLLHFFEDGGVDALLRSDV